MQRNPETMARWSNYNRSFLRTCWVCWPLVSLQPADAQWDPEVLQRVMDEAKETLVTVECVSRFEGSGESREIPRKLTGMVVSSSGLVLVHKNVETIESGDRVFSLSRPDKIQVAFQDRRRWEGTYIGADPDLDVSFFQVDPPEGETSSFSRLQFATRELAFTEPVFSVRLLPEEYNPRLEVAVARVSAILEKPRKLFRTQPPLTQFAGLPAFCSEGRVVGFIAAEDEENGGGDPLSLLSGAVSVRPSSLYLPLITTPPEKSEKGWLGIRMEPLKRDLAEIWGLPNEGGIIVTETIKGSPAEDAGLEAEDVIVAVKGRPLQVNTYADLGWFRQEVRNLRPGDRIEMDVVRGASKFGKETRTDEKVTVTLGLAPPSEAEAETVTFPEIGLKVQELTLDFLWSKRLPQNQEGVAARYVERAGPADIGKVEEDDIILSIGSQPVKDLEASKQVFEGLRREKPEEVILHVLRGQNRLFLKVTPDWE